MTVNSGSDFSGVKVGDRLWYVDKEVEVTKVCQGLMFPIIADGESFTLEGQVSQGGPQVLFYDKVEIVPPPRPKLNPEKCEACKKADSLHKFVPAGGAYFTENRVEYLLSNHLRKYHCTCEKSPSTEPRPKKLVKTMIEVRPYLRSDGSLAALSPTMSASPNWCGPAQAIEIEVEE